MLRLRIAVHSAAFRLAPSYAPLRVAVRAVSDVTAEVHPRALAQALGTTGAAAAHAPISVPGFVVTSPHSRMTSQTVSGMRRVRMIGRQKGREVAGWLLAGLCRSLPRPSV